MKRIIVCIILLMFYVLVSCKDKAKKKALTKEITIAESVSQTNHLFFKISLAEWSFNRAIFSGQMNPFDFAKKAKEMGFDGLEYVSTLYRKEIEKYATPEEGVKQITTRLKEESKKYNISNVLIMIDAEGSLASDDDAIRHQAVENHKKWVDAAAELGCHSIRVNLQGAQDLDKWIEYSVKGLTELCAYAATKNLNIIVENHGGYSSNATMLTEVMRKVGLSNCGTLPDFGNFCIRRIKRTDKECSEEYDRYKGTIEMMPFAKGVSAKSNIFNDKGEETEIDYRKMIQIVKNSGYHNYIGVEYEGSLLGEEAGILATQKLLVTVGKEIQ